MLVFDLALPKPVNSESNYLTILRVLTSIRCQTYLIARDQICVLLVWLKLIVQMVLLSECVS